MDRVDVVNVRFRTCMATVERSVVCHIQIRLWTRLRFHYIVKREGEVIRLHLLIGKFIAVNVTFSGRMASTHVGVERDYFDFYVDERPVRYDISSELRYLDELLFPFCCCHVVGGDVEVLDVDDVVSP